MYKGKYQRKPEIVEAEQIQYGPVYIRNRYEGTMIGYKGDWVVTYSNGDEWIYSDEDFKARFEPVRKKYGTLTCIVGSMFSGKSTELLRQARRHEYAGKKVILFKPILDWRYAREKVFTHDGNSMQAIPIDHHKPHEIFEHLDGHDVVCIDEVQFFETLIIEVIQQLLAEGHDVIVSGLDIDRFGNPFTVTMRLMPMAENVLKLRAVCHDCGDDAWISYGHMDEEGQVAVGGDKGDYIPLCRTCYHNRLERDNGDN